MVSTVGNRMFAERSTVGADGCVRLSV